VPPATARLGWDASRKLLVAVGGDGVRLGEFDGNATTATFVRLPTTGDPPPRDGAAVTITGDTLWMFGGSDGTCLWDDVWQLDLNSGAWRVVEPATSCV
jgi:hypothetical protein